MLTDPANQHTLTLSDEHRRMLEEGSAIAPDVIAARGVHTVYKPADLPECFNERQRRRAPGWLANLYRPNGEASLVFRPDRTPPDKPGWKYEQIPKTHGGGNVLDIHPFCRQWIAEKDVPVMFAEGTKKADAIITANRDAGVKAVVVSIIGCWNWVHNGGQPIPDMADIPLEGRNVVVIPDSDVLTKWQVQLAYRRLAEYLRDVRGANVYMTFLEDLPDGSKCGADDFFARSPGGTLAGLRLLTRRYNPEDFKLIRLSRDERLRAMLEDLRRTYAAMPAGKIGECSDRASMRDLIRRAEEHGKPSEARGPSGVVVRAPVRSVCKRTRLSTRSQAGSLKRLERDGYLKRIEEPKHKVEEKGTAYLLKASTEGLGRALGKQYREGGQSPHVSKEQGRERDPLRNAESYAGVYLTRGGSDALRNSDSYAGVHSARTLEEVPELRHSKVIHTWERHDGRRVVVDSEYIYRLAKPRQELVMYILDHDGEATEVELLERFGSKSSRMRDFRRRRIAPLLGHRYTRDKETGRERRVDIGPPLVSSGDGVVSLLPEWREALEEHRKQTGELEDNRRQEHKLRDQSRRYRERDRTPAGEEGPLIGKEKVARLVEERRKEEKHRWVEEQRQKVGETAATFLADELADVIGVRFKEARYRWSAKGGRVEDLRLAVVYGPFVFKREAVDDELYVYHEDGRTEDAYDRKVGEARRRLEAKL